MEIPHRFVSPKWIGGLTGLIAGWSVLAHAAYKRWGAVSLIYSGGLALLFVGYFLLEILLRLVHLKKRGEMDYEQLQAVVGLYSTLQPKLPLFQLRRYALGPDSASLYAYYIGLRRPGVVVELGSGASTVISGTQLKKNKKGKVISIDDDEHWVKDTQQMLKAQGLDKVAEVRYAPLKTINFQGETKQYYDLSVLDDIKEIDVLLVDGPIDRWDTKNRLPGMYLLEDRLTENAVVFADDTFRPNWKAAAKLWADKFGFKVWEPYPNDHETLIMERK